MIFPWTKKGTASQPLKSGAQERGNGVQRSATPQQPKSDQSCTASVHPSSAPRITTPVRPMVRFPNNPFCRIEDVIVEGLDFLAETPPNLPAATKCLANAEHAAASKVLPERLACRMRFFTKSLERIRKDLLRGGVGREFKEVQSLPELKPPCVDRAAEGLQSAALLKEAPALQTEMETLRHKVLVLEKKLERRRAARRWTLPPPALHIPRAGLQTAAVLIAGVGILVTSCLWVGRPGEIGALQVKVIPAGAELFSNGVAMGNQNYPLRLTGFAGDKMELEARLAGYSRVKRTLSLPAAAKNADETIELQPLPATLVVQSEPAAQQAWVRLEGEQPSAANNIADGIPVTAGKPMEISLTLPDYAPVSRTLEALKPGERRVLDLGALSIVPAALRLKVEPDDANFFVAYPGRDPIAFGNSNYLTGLTPKTPFKLIAERRGYASLTNTLNLKPGQLCDLDLGRMQPSPASLMVLALPRPFEMQVEWDGQSHNFGVAGEATGLPPGKPLVVTVAAEGCETWSTNLVLEPAEARTLSLGRLPFAQGYLLVNSTPGGGVVSYRVDGGMENVIGVTDTIPSLPLGHQVSVTLGKPGYISVTKSCLFQHSGEMLEFGTLKPSLTFLT
ncbi:MAG TPA: hypothetical protein VG754_10965, partial [Verrucomicrobiae bacterium]|nr:hypothetical protein [Verrucomicrobiae bacterium]